MEQRVSSSLVYSPARGLERGFLGYQRRDSKQENRSNNTSGKHCTFLILELLLFSPRFGGSPDDISCDPLQWARVQQRRLVEESF